MAEPNWELWGEILLGLQKGVRDVNTKLSEHDERFDRIDARLKGVEKELSGLTLRYRYALGAANDVDMRTTEEIEEVKRLIEALTSRVAALEPHDA